MLPELHQITHLVLRNKANKWKTVTQVEKYPIAELHEQSNQQLLKWVNHLEEHIHNWDQIRANLRNLQDIKDQLEEDAWDYLPPKNSMAQEAFINDLLFYVMVCSLIRISCRYFKSYCKDNQLPAKVYVLPAIQQPAKKLEYYLRPYYDDLYWLEETCFNNDIEYLEAYDHLIESVANLPDAEAIKRILNRCIPALCLVPDNHRDEVMRIDSMRQVSEAMQTFIQSKSWSSFRCILALSVSLSEASAFELDDYFNWLDSYLFENTPLEEEVVFWKQTFTQYKVLNPHLKHGAVALFYDRLIKYLKSKVKKSKCTQVCKRFAHFSGTPIDFARYIYRFAEHKQLSINNSDNLKEVSRYFYDLVFVKHSKFNKRIDFETIYSYVRRFSNGELA